MPTPAELRHDLYRELYFAERTRREQIRGGLAMPVTAVAFSVYAFSALATSIDLTTWQALPVMLLVLLALSSIACLIAGIVCLVRVEWLLIFNDLPDLPELIKAEGELEAALAQSPAEARGPLLDQQFRDLVTGSFFIAYRNEFIANSASAKYRSWAVRFLILGLLLLLLAYMVLPINQV